MLSTELLIKGLKMKAQETSGTEIWLVMFYSLVSTSTKLSILILKAAFICKMQSCLN